DLINGLLAGVEGHQVRSVAAHSPTRVIGVSDWRLPHLLAQFLINGAHGPLGLFKRVLRDSALGDRDPGQFSQNRWQSTHRDSVTIVQRMGHGLDPGAQSMRCCAILVRRYAGVLSSRLPPALAAPADLHLE